MKKIIKIAGLCCCFLSFAAAPASAIYCSNCSTVFVQALDRITNLSQLSTMTSQYTEDIAQTLQQVKMVQNMIQNTAALPSQLRGQLSGQLAQLASLTNQLNVKRGEQNALAQVFNTLFPDQSEFANLVGAASAQIEAANQQYQTHYENWSREVDNASMATFQVSGRQLEELQNAGMLEGYIDSLLNTPDGQMQAIQASNQLAALQIQEQRQMREMMATSAQSALAAQMKNEKQDEISKERWKKACDTTGKYEDLNKHTLPLP